MPVKADGAVWDVAGLCTRLSGHGAAHFDDRHIGVGGMRHSPHLSQALEAPGKVSRVCSVFLCRTVFASVLCSERSLEPSSCFSQCKDS